MKSIHQVFFGLLRLAVSGTPYEVSPMTDEDWAVLYRMAHQQSLKGLLYAAVSQLPTGQHPPMELAMQWISEAEANRGMNDLQNHEAARLTKLFGDAGRRTAILKGQANARLYPDKLSRQPGDIDIWVEGGRESVIDLLISMGLLDEKPTISNAGKRDKATTSYHHAHLPATKDGIAVEVHYRPSSGNFNPWTNRPLQAWLEREIQQTTLVEEGFYVPSTRFAMMMQLAHIQRHFLGGGIGMRHVCDYYLLLQNATEADRKEVAARLRSFGLHQTAGALMWVLGEVLQLRAELMICPTDSYRGEWMLREIMTGGNFGHYAERHQQGMWRRVFAGKWRHLRLMRFNFWEVFWLEANYWKTIVQTLPERIRRRSFSLGEADKRDTKRHGDKIL